MLARVQADDPEAWQRLVHLYSPAECCTGAAATVSSDQDCADIFQEVFQAVVVYVGGFRKERDGDTFRGWLRRITQNKLRDHFRRLGREAPGVGGSSAQERLTQLPERQPNEDDIVPDDAGEPRAVRSGAVSGKLPRGNSSRTPGRRSGKRLWTGARRRTSRRTWQ